MIDIIRSIFRKLTGTADRYYEADGRPDEKIKGKMCQHYGFKSSPPEGVELIHLEQNNLGISVAENDGNIVSSFISSNLDQKDTVIYTQTGNSVYLKSNGTIVVTTVVNGTNTSITFNGKSIECGSALEFNNGQSAQKYYLVTSKFLDDFCAHIHTSATPGSPTSTPLINGIPATAILLNQDLSKSIKSD